MNIKYISGKYATATIYLINDKRYDIDKYALEQITQLCNLEANKDNVIRVMPDVHPGNGCVIGLTMTLKAESVLPNLVGTDIGCGVSVTALDNYTPDFTRLDSIMASKIPSGFAVHRKIQPYDEIEKLCCAKHVQLDRARKSLGTLGQGNHFCEVARGNDDRYYLIIHSGSRRLGKEVCEWYLKQGRQTGVPHELTWISGDLRDQYLHDMQIVQRFASANRQRIADILLKGMKWKACAYWESVHNYIDFSRSIPILRKGAISSAEGQPVIIPGNMRDGSLIGVGKGNAAWNWSAPHGTGRIATRESVRNQVTLPAFKKAMLGIHSACISRGTLDESPFAYRQLTDIAEAIVDTVDIQDFLRPVYNFKAGGSK